MSQSFKIQLRKGTLQEWETSNPILLAGEIGVDLSNYRIKTGDGFSKWNDLPYVDESSVSLLDNTIGSETDYINELEQARL